MPLHPMLTDLPIGCWTSAFVLDIVGGKKSRPAAQLLVGLGVLSALPTAASGAADWSDTGGRAARRVSSTRRRTPPLSCCTRGRGKPVVRTGTCAASPSASSAPPRRRSAVSRRSFARTRGHRRRPHGLRPRPVRLGADHRGSERLDRSTPGRGRRRSRAPPPTDNRILAVGATCPHRGAPLEEGTFDADTVTCPWHGSCFALADGALLRGPSAMPLPRYETRVKNGTVEVRALAG